MAGGSAKSNALLGTAELTLKIRDLESAHEVASQIIGTGGLAERIWKIDIETKDEEEEEEEPKVESQLEEKKDPIPEPTNEERFAARKAKEAEGALLAIRLCEPLIQILTATLSRGGHLRQFSWRASYFNGTYFTRPHTFWTALFAHSLTLETLLLDYFEHEVLQLPPPTSSFPALKRLTLDTVSAHGDDGTGIEGILKSCPNLEILDFAWPGCDLSTCQIRNITWDYTFPSLRRLDLNGYDFAPAALAAFLSRHPGIEILNDRVDCESTPAPLAPTSLPNLKALRQSNRTLDGGERYFDEQAGRPIRHLALRASQWNGRALADLAKMPQVKSQVKVLELYGDVPEWREEVDDEDSSDEEEEGKEPYQSPPRMPAVLKACLAEFEALQELGVSLDSDGIWYTRPDGVFGEPDPATGEDVKYLLAHIPPTTKIRALRLWDPRADPLPQELLDDFPVVPDTLEYFAWEGKEKSLYKLERVDGKIRAVLCRAVRMRRTDDGEDDWTQRRILDF